MASSKLDGPGPRQAASAPRSITLVGQEWGAEYTSYRRGTALGRFDAEYEYWRRLQARIWEMRRGLQPGKPLPPLDSLRR